jgi:hypothetical protein
VLVRLPFSLRQWCGWLGSVLRTRERLMGTRNGVGTGVLGDWSPCAGRWL